MCRVAITFGTPITGCHGEAVPAQTHRASRSSSCTRFCGISAMRRRRQAKFSGRCRETRRHDERGHHGSALGAAVRTGEQPCLSSEHKTAQRSFGWIVGETDPSVMDKAGKAVPSLEQTVDWLEHVGTNAGAGQIPPGAKPQGRSAAARFSPGGSAAAPRRSAHRSRARTRTASQSDGVFPAQEARSPSSTVRDARSGRYRLVRRKPSGRAPSRRQASPATPCVRDRETCQTPSGTAPSYCLR